jgi:hypothetical protein
MVSFAAVPALLGSGPGYADLVDLVVVVAAFSSFVLP